MSETPTAARPRRLGLILPWAGFAVILLAWVAYWLAARQTALDRLEAWAAAERAAGAVVELGAVRAGGFPLRLSLTIDQPSYAPASGLYRIAAPRLFAHVNLTDPMHVMLAPGGPVRVALRGGREWTLQADEASMSLRWAKGGLARAGLAAEGVRATADGGAFGLDRLVVNARPDPRDPTARQVALDAEGLALAAPAKGLEGLGSRIETLRLRLVAREGAGVVEGLSFAWGPAQGEATGAIGLDALSRPEGELALTLETPAETFAALKAPEGFAPEAVRLIARGGVLSLNGAIALRPLEPLR